MFYASLFRREKMHNIEKKKVSRRHLRCILKLVLSDKVVMVFHRPQYDSYVQSTDISFLFAKSLEVAFINLFRRNYYLTEDVLSSVERRYQSSSWKIILHDFLQGKIKSSEVKVGVQKNRKDLTVLLSPEIRAKYRQWIKWLFNRKIWLGLLICTPIFTLLDSIAIHQLVPNIYIPDYSHWNYESKLENDIFCLQRQYLHFCADSISIWPSCMHH